MNALYSSASSRLRRSVVPVLLALSFVGFALPTGVFAHQVESETVTIKYPYAFPTPPGVQTGGVFFDAITAVGDRTDRLVSASSPIAGRVEIHRMRMDGDIMRMREVNGVGIDKANPVSFEKGAHDGHHLMLMELTDPLTDGMSLPVTLRFEKAGEIEVEVKVVPFGSHPKSGGMKPMDHSQHK